MKSRSASGWSLIELMVVVAIIAILVSMSFPAYNYIRAQLDSAACVSNLKTIHAGLSTYLQDHNMVWPQEPNNALGGNSESTGQDNDDDDGSENWVWWYETLRPYGVTRKSWVCPADRDGRENDESRPETLAPSYSPTTFDEVPNTAFRWKNTPWIIERGQNHGRGKGPNMILPDGQVVQGVGVFQE
jgi:prepilin-type N-terminal cleavage/methylation domain-containing protein